MENTLPDYSNILNNIQESFKKMNDDLFKDFDWKAYQEHVEHENKLFIKLSQYGWYISMHMTLEYVDLLLLHLEYEDVKSLDKCLMQYFKKKIHASQDTLINKFPNAENVIKEAIMAHKKKMYYASTILFLSLADGYLDGYTFKTKKDKAKVNEILSEGKGITSHLKLVVGKVSAIDSDNGGYHSSLNRHEVMHGLKFDYGSEVNSLKAFSILNLLAECYTPKSIKEEI